MGINRIIEILEIERECIRRNDYNAISCCDRECDKCDLLQEPHELDTAYTLAISILKTVHGDRKVMNPTGEQNEFTIL